MSVKKHIKNTVNKFFNNLSIYKKIISNQKEIINYNLFRGIIQDSIWLKYKSFTTGGWAMDNAALFTLYNVFNHVKPKNIIEFGLGQSSKMVYQYTSFYNDSNAITIEHDKKWYNFFISELLVINNKLNYNENNMGGVKILDIKNTIYKGYETLTHNNLEEIINGNKYDLIIVDGPYGSNNYSRPQIISMLPHCLSETFCIFFDDSNRKGEQDTIDEVCNILTKNNILFHVKHYEGEQCNHTIICSEDLYFLSTLR